MPEEPREVFEAAPSSLNSDLDKVSILFQVEERLAKATSIEEIELWTRVREQIIHQDECVKATKQRRILERIQVISKLGFSFGAFTLGIILIFLGISGFGAVLTGAGIYLIAPEYIGEVLNREDGDSNRTTQRSSLVVGLILIFTTVIALYAVEKSTILSPLVQVLLTISGMTTIAALAAFDQHRKLGRNVDQLSLNNRKSSFQYLTDSSGNQDQGELKENTGI